ncbi:uncharacterized protein G2W53_041372 [Senna tora]|uniref:Uncharacterized protein n=1 Tax=Senna tora TaxID=362788 RepID=A0A834SEZ7_9FABA|nr:uncharacterized protein G2W53_041372 [Senna tora]
MRFLRNFGYTKGCPKQGQSWFGVRNLPLHWRLPVVERIERS